MSIELIVHFLRSEDETFDDCIRISKQNSNFLVTSVLLFNHTESARLRTAAVMSHHGVTRFLQDVLALVALDSLPFESVQVSCPLAPSVSFDLANGAFEKARETIIRLVDTSLTHWPDEAPEPGSRAHKRRRMN
jgi:hypothetical protein